ncbi:MAG: glycine--tRNA ligase subunit beta [Chromatiales bacterium]|nr:glycine--tRNA ligase subunit beta [Chromatiales bacterium]
MSVIENRDLLIELGTEELPPKALKKLSDAFTKGIVSGLKGAQLNFGQVDSFATPRRLAVLIHGLDTAQPNRDVEKKGPAVKAAYDADGNPTKALEGFSRSCGITPDQLEKIETPKGEWLVFREQQQGEQTSQLIPDMIKESLHKLPIPKRMRWGALDSEFVRPVQWLLILFGDEVVDTEILSQKSGRITRGHRFHCPEPITITTPASYAETLKGQGRVIADYAERKNLIEQQVIAAAKEAKGEAVIDPNLLDEVTGLVEWPIAVVGNFDKKFLEVPPESLISAMKGHQKYFHMVDESQQLLPNFITLSNIESSNPDVVRHGNERVITPRLTDAMFFWEQDAKHSLESRLGSLSKVVFQKQLGTLRDKTDRIVELSQSIASELGSDREQAALAAMLSKCDLMTEMVGEFPDLQGLMGYYYAKKEGISEKTAKALDECYMPRNAADNLPEGEIGQIVAIADRIDTLVGIFGIGQKPTGTKDPFALRRASLALLRIMIEKGLDLDLEKLLQQASENLKNQLSDDADSLLLENLTDQTVALEAMDYTLERVNAYYQDRGVHYSVIDAVLALRPTSPLDLDQRISAVAAFQKLDEAESLAAANKRIGNILRKVEGGVSDNYDSALFNEEAEKALAIQLEEVTAQVEPLFSSRNYTDGLKQLAHMRDSVDHFFDSVMVMDDDEAIRNNRLALLKRLNQLFTHVADLSLLKGDSK